MYEFADRIDGGRQLAARLRGLRDQNVVVLGLPRGGVPVANEVADALDAPLDVIVVRKLGVPFQHELAMGAIGEGGARVLDVEVVSATRVTESDIATVERRERSEMVARVARFRRNRDRIDLHGRTVVIVDDGIATGSTARVACHVARHLGAARVILAVPVGPVSTIENLPEADEVVCLATPEPFTAVGNHYRDFSPTTDDAVIEILDAAAHRYGGPGVGAAPARVVDVDVAIPVGSIQLEGHLHLPEATTGIVVFAHGSGSSRHSSRNQFVASVLNRAGLGTLLLDLLTPGEERDRANVFDIELLASRLVATAEWLTRLGETSRCRVGYFGASTGAGAALWAAADAGTQVAAVVSRGGRPDLAGPRLAAVRAPTLLIVGGADSQVLELNRHAQAQLRCPNELAIVEGATHLFEEPGTLAEAASLARDWFSRYLLPATAGPTTGDRR